MQAGRWWPLSIAGVLGLTVVANGFLLYVATKTDTEAVEPDYYRKAVNWDSAMAQARENVALAWQVQGRLDPGGELTLRLTDSTGAPLDGARVAVEGFALAQAAEFYHATLALESAGTYEGTIPRPHGGLHEVRVTVIRGSDRFTAVLRGTPGDRLIPRA